MDMGPANLQNTPTFSRDREFLFANTRNPMNLHEYQSKRLFADYGIPVPRGIPAESADAAVKAAEELGGELWVVKAQAHTGGRGKAGGVKLAQDAG